MSISQIIVFAVIASGLWYWSRDWNSEDRGMLVLFLIALGAIMWVAGPENVQIGFPQGDG